LQAEDGGEMKRLYWFLRREIPDVWSWFLSKLPGSTGIGLRMIFVRRMLGACGKHPVFHTNVRITSPKKLKIGDRCAFGQGTFLTCGGGITMGNDVATGPDAKIWSVNHIFEDPDVPWMKQGFEHKEVIIEDDVWIGASTFVKPGVRIGKGAIISAGTILSKSVPPFAIVAGNPGRVVGWRKRPESAGEKMSAAFQEDEKE
jgi:acetyltransferase-like isoleucine patch superfamily enzyme